jgi:hypothetical protein
MRSSSLVQANLFDDVGAHRPAIHLRAGSICSKLARQVSFESLRVAWFCAALLSIPFADRYPPLALSPAQGRLVHSLESHHCTVFHHRWHRFWHADVAEVRQSRHDPHVVLHLVTLEIVRLIVQALPMLFG